MRSRVVSVILCITLLFYCPCDAIYFAGVFRQFIMALDSVSKAEKERGSDDFLRHALSYDD